MQEQLNSIQKEHEQAIQNRLDAQRDQQKSYQLKKEQEKLLEKTQETYNRTVEDQKKVTTELEQIQIDRTAIKQTREAIETYMDSLKESLNHGSPSEVHHTESQKHPTHDLSTFRVVVDREELFNPHTTAGDSITLYLDTLPWSLRYCSSGSCFIGSHEGKGRPEERPRHQIQISWGYWLSESPITQSIWRKVMNSEPSQFRGDHHPVESITWLDAVRFCNRMSEMQGFQPAYHLETGIRTLAHWNPLANGYRLPTEAEWEYAARSGLDSGIEIYSGGHELEQFGWFSKNSGGETHPVGLKEPNHWGFFDFCGNIWEWCHDEWLKDAYKGRRSVNRDPVHYQAKLSPRVIRGGGWYDFANRCRISYRPGLEAEGSYGIGFRPCLPLHLLDEN